MIDKLRPGAGKAGLAPQPHEDYGRLEINLTSARTNEEINIQGDYIAKIKYDGSETGCYFRLDHRHAAKIYAKEFKALKRRYARLFLTNTAQAGKVLIIQINELAVSEIEPDAAGQLSDIQTALEKIDDIVQTEDDAHVSTQKGVMALAVRKNLPSTMGVDGDYVPLISDTHGELYVTDTDVLAQMVTDNAVLDTIDADTGAIKTAVEVIDDWDDGADHCETKEYFGGAFYENQVTTTASDNVFEEAEFKLRSCYIYNNHATVTSAIGDAVAQRYELAPGESVRINNVDISTISHIRIGGANGTLIIIGSGL